LNKWPAGLVCLIAPPGLVFITLSPQPIANLDPVPRSDRARRQHLDDFRSPGPIVPTNTWTIFARQVRSCPQTLGRFPLQDPDKIVLHTRCTRHTRHPRPNTHYPRPNTKRSRLTVSPSHRHGEEDSTEESHMSAASPVRSRLTVSQSRRLTVTQARRGGLDGGESYERRLACPEPSHSLTVSSSHRHTGTERRTRRRRVI